MIGYEIEIAGYQEQISKLQDLAGIADGEFRKTMSKAVAVIERNVKPLTPVYRGILRASIGSKVMTEGGSIVGRVGSSLRDEEYPKVMEFGRQPGSFPPPGALVEWVRRVIRPPKWKVYSVAFNIARKIAARGIKGRFYMKKGWEKSKTVVEILFDQTLEIIVKKVSNGRS